MSNYKVEISGINTNNLKVLKKEEMFELFKKYQSGDESAKTKLIEGNLKLVLSIVRKLSRNKEDMSDLFQIGCIGLTKAVMNFDLSHNVLFSTYAVPMISGEVKRYIRDNNALRISRSIKENAYKILSYIENYNIKYGKDPTNVEIAKNLKLTEFEVYTALNSLKEPMSISQPIYNDGSDTIYLIEQLADEKRRVEVDETISLDKALNTINKREQSIIRARYDEGKTQSEVADLLNISQAQVSRLEKNALQKIRKLIS